MLKRQRGVAVGLLLTLAAVRARGGEAPAHALPLPCSPQALARAAGFETPPDDLLFDLSRRLYPYPGGAPIASSERAAVLALLRAPHAAAASEPPQTIDVPLRAETWDEVVFGRRLEPDARLVALLEDRRAALLYRGLAALDAPTLAWLEREPGLLRMLHRQRAEAFALFAPSLAVDASGLRLPGGPEHAPSWAAAVGAPVEPAAAFVEALFGKADGAGAWLLDTLRRLDDPRQRFALGAWLPADERPARFEALARAFARAGGWWRLDRPPRPRPAPDPSALLRLVAAADDGRPAAPVTRGLWQAALRGTPESAGEGASGALAADAAWLAERLIESEPAQAGLRLRALSFAQRRLGPMAAARDAAAALAAYLRYEALLLTLERVGVHDAVTLSTAAAVAGRLERAPAERRVVQLVLLQGALGLVERAHFAGTLDGASAARLARSLLTEAPNDGVARWLDRVLLPRLASTVGDPWPATSAETVVARALGGDTPARRGGRATFEWEGLRLRVDLARAERRRIEAARRRQGGNRLDAVLALHRAAWRAGHGDADAPGALAAAAARLEPAAPPGQPGSQARPQALARVRLADAGALPRIAQRAIATADTLLADVLASLLYAALLGPPDAAVLAGENVARRHVLDDGDAADAARPWELPRQRWGPGVRWHVRGSLLALDLALAPYALRRLDAELPPRAPALPDHERQAFAQAAALLAPLEVDAAQRDALADALARGEERSRRLGREPAAAIAVAEWLGIHGRRRLLLGRWMAAGGAAPPAFFTLAELVALGGDRDDAPWAAGLPAAWRRGPLELEPPPRQPSSACPGPGLLADCFPDLHLHVIRELAALELPAALARPVLVLAMSDLLDAARPVDADDVTGLARWVQALPRQRFEDYVSALVGDGVLVPAARSREAAGGDADGVSASRQARPPRPPR